jgi:hypothetical protein
MGCLSRLRSRRASSVAEQVAPGEAGPTGQPVIEFTAFTPTSRVTGRLALAADRLSDALNDATGPIAIEDATVVELDSFESTTSTRLDLSRDELLIVRGSGPPGSAARRYRTLAYEAVLTIGPYRVTGSIHARPGANPISGIYHRRVMIPITEAVLSYPVLGRTVEETASTLIVHRDHLTSIRLTEEVMAFRNERPTPSEPRLGEPIDHRVLEPSRRAVGPLYREVSITAHQHSRQATAGEALT